MTQFDIDILYKEGLERASSYSISYLLDIILSYQAHGNITKINHIFECIDVSRLAPELMIGLLRFNYPIRLKIMEWNPYLARMNAEISFRGILDGEKILRGL